MHCVLLLSSDPHHMLMTMTRVLMVTMRVLLQMIVVMADAMVILFVVMGKPKFSIPRFEGGTDIEEYLTWELKIEKL
jgi:hypothetical protein